MFVAEKVLLILVISLTVLCRDRPQSHQENTVAIYIWWNCVVCTDLIVNQFWTDIDDLSSIAWSTSFKFTLFTRLNMYCQTDYWLRDLIMIPLRLTYWRQMAIESMVTIGSSWIYFSQMLTETGTFSYENNKDIVSKTAATMLMPQFVKHLHGFLRCWIGCKFGIHHKALKCNNSQLFMSSHIYFWICNVNWKFDLFSQFIRSWKKTGPYAQFHGRVMVPSYAICLAINSANVA